MYLLKLKDYTFKNSYISLKVSGESWTKFNINLISSEEAESDIIVFSYSSHFKTKFLVFFV
jgi:hypothetical protein